MVFEIKISRIQNFEPPTYNTQKFPNCVGEDIDENSRILIKEKSVSKNIIGVSAWDINRWWSTIPNNMIRVVHVLFLLCIFASTLRPKAAQETTWPQHSLACYRKLVIKGYLKSSRYQFLYQKTQNNPELISLWQNLKSVNNPKHDHKFFLNSKTRHKV